MAAVTPAAVPAVATASTAPGDGPHEDSSVADALLPRPQHLVEKDSSLELTDGWQVLVDASDPGYAFAATWLVEKLDERLAGGEPAHLEVIDVASSPESVDSPRARRIMLGSPAEHAHLRDAMVRRWRRLPEAVGDEGYLL
ncbi:MAG: hypothetical protein ACK2UL_01540, partial [Anaerolineae bacterium]